MKKFFQVILLLFVATNMFVLCSCNKDNNTETKATESSITTVQPTTLVTQTFSKFVVTAELVNVRKEPNLESEILDSYYKNTLIEATTTSNEEWNKIKISDSETAYIFADFVSPISDSDYETYLNYQIINKEKRYGVITSEFDNIYTFPTNDSEIIATYRKNDTIEILGITQNDWFVIDHNEITCYIPPNNITLLSESQYTSYMKEPIFVPQDKDKCTLIGSYSTDYSFSGSNREFNLEKAANEMNGMIIQSNTMFNWCRDIGPCGKDEGYLESTEILNGEYIQGYGGGICQVSSTLCAAVIQTETNIEFIDRKKHGIAQSYIPRELDATVSYPDCNFIFRNNNPFSIMIETICSDDNTLTINIYQIDKLII